MSPHWCSFHLLMSIVFLEISDVTGGVQRQVMFLRGQYWDQHCSTLSVTWTMGLRAPSESLPVTPSFWSSFSTHWRDGMLSTEASAGQRGGYMWTSWTSMWPSTRSCTWVRTTQSANTGWAENGLRAALEKTSESWSTRSSTRHAIIQQCAVVGQKTRCVLGCIKTSMGRRLSEVILPLDSVFVRPHPEGCIQLWGPQHRMEMDLLKWAQRRPCRWPEGRSHSPMEMCWESGVFQPGEKKFLGRQHLPELKGSLQERQRETFNKGM